MRFSAFDSQSIRIIEYSFAPLSHKAGHRVCRYHRDKHQAPDLPSCQMHPFGMQGSAQELDPQDLFQPYQTMKQNVQLVLQQSCEMQEKLKYEA